MALRGNNSIPKKGGIGYNLSLRIIVYSDFSIYKSITNCDLQIVLNDNTT